MSRDEFRVTWSADDGYVGSRPHSFFISQGDLDEDMDDKELSSLFSDMLQNEFEQSVSPCSEDEANFIEWAKEQIKTMKENQ